MWLLCGVIAIWRNYFGQLKYWYEKFEVSIWKDYKKGDAPHLKTLIAHSPVFLVGGPITIILFECLFYKENTWWFKVPEIEE